ncbi:MAG: hypothetical protein MZV65_19370 [Chromatiales bacterium]|nr:hypothetical protein [Chromatiales bacterium]
MHNALLVAVEEYLHPTQTIVLRGSSEAMRPWQARCTKDYAPRRLTLAVPTDARTLPGILAQRDVKNGVTAYVCSGHACEAPVTSLEELEAALARK